MASLLGPEKYLFLSLDDKAHVKLGIVAAKKQMDMVMHIDYQVCLPSHDYVVAPKHYFIPSVCSFLTVSPLSIGQKNAVSYSGPMGVFIRSGKHDQSIQKHLCL